MEENRPGPKLVADIAIFAEGRVALVKYTDVNAYDHQRGWFLPDDLIGHLEHPDAAAHRILSEQLGLLDSAPVLDHIESFTGKDRSWHLVFHYRLDLPLQQALIPSPDVSEVAWFSPDAFPPRREVAHGGWAIGIVEQMLAKAVAA